MTNNEPSAQRVTDLTNDLKRLTQSNLHLSPPAANRWTTEIQALRTTLERTLSDANGLRIDESGVGRFASAQKTAGFLNQDAAAITEMIHGHVEFLKSFQVAVDTAAGRITAQDQG